MKTIPRQGTGPERLHRNKNGVLILKLHSELARNPGSPADSGSRIGSIDNDSSGKFSFGSGL